MTAALIAPAAARPGHAQTPPWRLWAARHVASFCLLSVLLAIVGAANAWNLQGWPGRVNDDEGTYVAQAWAMLYLHHLSHYTYWYDHPPLGWAIIAGYAWLTGGFHRDLSAVMIGREVMWLANQISCALLYLLARRLGFPRAAAAATVILFGLSPLAMYYHRMVFLDNLATMWVLAALLVATSPRRSLAASFWSAVCFAAAVLCKETTALLLPPLLWLLCQHTEPRIRRWNVGIFLITCSMLVLTYPVFAALRGELVPGPGHVSLAWALWWQFFGRPGTGSVLDPHSVTFALVRHWVALDPWLLLAGATLAPAGLVIRRLRPFAAALLLQVAVMLKGGYLPEMFVIAMLPFCALLITGIADTCWTGAVSQRHERGSAALRTLRIAVGCIPAVIGVAGFALVVGPRWATTLEQQATVHGDAAELAATAWVVHHVPRRDVVVTDDYMWTDLRVRGMNPLWFWKIGLDPQVTRIVLRHGYKSIDYIVLPPLPPAWLKGMPALREALAHSQTIRSFGDGITARVVLKPARSPSQGRDPRDWRRLGSPRMAPRSAPPAHT